MNQTLYQRDHGGLLVKCADTDEDGMITTYLQGGACGGHWNWKSTAYKILRVGYYWHSFFSDVYAKVRACVECQKLSGKQKILSLALKPITVDAPFQKWGLDFIGEINPYSSGHHKYILIAIDFFTKWLEVIPTRKTTDKVIINFLEKNILSRFGYPRKIVTGNATAFKSREMVHFYERHNIILKY